MYVLEVLFCPGTYILEDFQIDNTQQVTSSKVVSGRQEEEKEEKKTDGGILQIQTRVGTRLVNNL